MSPRSWLLPALTLLFLAAGCSSKPQAREDETTVDLRHIARAYGVVQAQHNRPPKTLDEIKSVLAELHAGDLNEEPDLVLTSSRDGLPYVVVLGVNLGAVSSHDIFLYEQSGKDGSRYVMTLSRDVRQLTDAEFAAATFANQHKPEVERP